MNDRRKREWADRVDRVVEGLLSAEELACFHADVVRDPVLRAFYVEHVWLHGALLADRARLPELLAVSPPVAMGGRWRWFAGLGLAASAVFFGFWGGSEATREKYYATIVQAEHATWAGSTLPTLTSSRLGAGVVSLVEGVAVVRFASGAVVTLEAPTTLEIVSAMLCRLPEGSITAEVPPSAHGFTVQTPDLTVVDLGTRFGVTASSTGHSHVFVFEGEVELEDSRRGLVRKLPQGKAYHVATDLISPSSEPNRPDPSPVIDGWTSIATSFGRGADGYVRRGYAAPTGGEPLLMVKHSTLLLSRNNERRAILTFDLSALQVAKINEVQLLLDPEPSGYGFVTMVPDSRFAVYGVRSSAGAGWSEASVTWDTLPGTDDTGVLLEQVERVAEFWLPRGGSGAPFTIRSEALATFVRGCPAGLATFLIVRETGETDPTGLVHAFASKEHPTARPPTLRVR